MNDEKELHELSEQIADMSSKEQFRLLELVLAAIRRKREETLAEMLASQAKFLELEKRQKEATQQEIAAAEAWYAKQQPAM